MQIYGIALLLGVFTFGLWAAVPVFGLIVGTGLGVLFLGYTIKLYQEDEVEKRIQDELKKSSDLPIPPFKGKKKDTD